MHSARKQTLFSSMRGDVLELGAAPGENFGVFPADIVYTGVDRNGHGLERAKESAASCGFPPAILDLQHSTMQSYLATLPDECFDAVVGTEVGAAATPEIHEAHLFIPSAPLFFEHCFVLLPSKIFLLVALLISHATHTGAWVRS